MKRKTLLMTATLLSAFAANAQTFAKQDNVLGLNVGIGGSYGVPVSLSYEKGIYDINDKMSIGVGGLIGYGSSSDNIQVGKWKYSNFLLGARGAWHYTAVDKFDLYGGVMLGYDIASSKFTWSDPAMSDHYDAPSSSAGGILWGAYAGARYYFTPTYGVNAEVGYGLSYLNIGVSYKF